MRNTMYGKNEIEIKKILNKCYSDITEQFSIKDMNIQQDNKNNIDVDVVYIDMEENNYNNIYIALDKSDDTLYIYETNKSITDLNDEQKKVIAKYIYDDEQEDINYSDWFKSLKGFRYIAKFNKDTFFKYKKWIY